MKTQELAQKLLQRRSSMCPVVMPGEMIASIGNDAMHEALQRRWLVPNADTGFLQITTDMSQVKAMQEAAETCPECKCKECKCSAKAPRLESHDIALRHASRHPNFIHELLSPATGHDPARTAPTAPSAASTPTTAPTQPARKPVIGDAVVVAENGKTYTGTVGSVENGRYKLTFGGPEKPAQDREYSDNEIRLAQEAR